jgi:RimJ/RimL family protein N-acetyltransferase
MQGVWKALGLGCGQGQKRFAATMPVLSLFLSLFSFGFSMSSIQVRPATLRDAKAIAQIHTVSAQEAYKGLVPDEQLKSMSSVEKRQAYWREAIEYCEPQVQVAVDGEKIVGFVGYDRSRDEKSRPTTGEIWAIYAAPTHWNQGVGLALWDAARDGLQEEGCTNVTAWVPLRNERALRFHELAGFKRELSTAKTAVIGGVKIEEVRLKRPINA